MKEKRLPRNGKEGLLYGGVIAFITVIVMLSLNVFTAVHKINLDILLSIIKLISIIWVIVMLLEGLVVGKISNKLVEHFSSEGDGFNAKILFNILFCVTFMSISMTIIGGMIGMGKFTLEPFKTFLTHWPRNFCVAFWCEILLAQPIARFVMKLIHSKDLEV